MNGWISVGSDVFYKLHTCSHKNPESSGALIRFGGTLEDEGGYDRDDICVVGISWCSECRGPTWELKSLEPFHVEPSILTTCHNHPEHHGFIREGKWINA